MRYFPGMNLDNKDKDALLSIIHQLAQGGRWYCGVRGNRNLARACGCRPKDLSVLSHYCWNRIAYLACDPGREKAAYVDICASLYAKLPVGLRWKAP